LSFLSHCSFLAELTKEVFNDLESSKYQHAEMRVSIYGRKAMEWVSGDAGFPYLVALACVAVNVL
jgi:hypothetical protein